MTPQTTLTPPANARPATTPRRETRAARFARYGVAGEPPLVDELAGDDTTLIEELFARAAGACCLPPLAVREVIENLVHAEFEGACVSVLDAGAALRVSDCGPGIADKDRAMEPGFSTACERQRAVVRGVGSGLPVAAHAMHAAGGDLALEDNLRGGTVVTLSSPLTAPAPAANELTERARQVMAVLVEIGPATPAGIAAELAMDLAPCGRELVLLEHRSLVERHADGTRALTDAGTALLATLF